MVQIAKDSSDHISFFCKKCDKQYKIIGVETISAMTMQSMDKCTYINLHCENCGKTTHKKFYWKLNTENWRWSKTK